MSETPTMLEEIASVMHRYGFNDVRYPAISMTPNMERGGMDLDLSVTAIRADDLMRSEHGKHPRAHDSEAKSLFHSRPGLKADSRQ